ncbi:MAG: hypothetical protein DID91_2727703936 [Candidatus Nitrotoga sp. MKT]|nr:MAG: hypothetical protein DID91_2727703936 [Candidatus Nitrotoga sp. MKT]
MNQFIALHFVEYNQIPFDIRDVIRFDFDKLKEQITEPDGVRKGFACG